MFFPDKELAVREMYRVIKPGGRVDLNVFCSPDHVPSFAYLIEALNNCAGTAAADFMRAPFIMESTAEMRSLFKQAGFTDIEVVIRIDELRYPSVAHLVQFETLNIPDPAVHTQQVQQALTRKMQELTQSNIDDHGVVFPVQHFVVVATR